MSAADEGTRDRAGVCPHKLLQASPAILHRRKPIEVTMCSRSGRAQAGPLLEGWDHRRYFQPTRAMTCTTMPEENA